MDPIDKLLAIEEIKQLKSRYFYGFDHKDWDMWREQVWAPDGALIVPEADMRVEGIENILEWVIAQAADQVSVHHGHMPDIEILSETEAKGVWAMEDRLYRSTGNPLADGTHYLHGFGHYRETYVKLDMGWRIKTTQLTRLRVERLFV